MDIPKSVRELMQKHHDLRVFISQLTKENRELKKEIEQLKDQVAEIKSYIFKPKNQNPNPKPLGPPKNHEPHNRPIPDKIHERKELELKCCPECNHELGKPVRNRKRYVEDIRQPEPINTEYTIPSYWCKNCNKQVSPKPVGVIPHCRFGVRLMLGVTFLRGKMHLPYNKITTLLEQCFGITVSEGCLVDAITRFADYCGQEFEQIKTEIHSMPVVNHDTTGWRINGQNKVLWDFISEKHVLLLVRDTKAQGTIYQTLGKEFKGISVSDCARENDNLGWKQQKCWAHVLRRSGKFESHEGIKLHTFLKALRNLAINKGVFIGELLDGLDSACSVSYADPKCIKLVNWIKRYRDEWFTFVEHKDIGVESTNNIAERGLRPSVVMRKITGGNRAPKGAHNHEVIMSVIGTWDKQNKDFFDEGLKVIQSNLH